MWLELERQVRIYGEIKRTLHPVHTMPDSVQPHRRKVIRLKISQLLTVKLVYFTPSIQREVQSPGLNIGAVTGCLRKALNSGKDDQIDFIAGFYTQKKLQDGKKRFSHLS